MAKPLVFFDGVCALCNGFVDFLLRHDKGRRLQFAPLQGAIIKTTKAAGLAQSETIVFLKNDRIYERSRAVIESLAELQGGWKLVKALLIIPAFIRDFVYDFIARHRYNWFGRLDQCRRPTPEDKERILE